MLINAELLLQYQKCKRRPFLNVRGDKTQQDAPSDLLLKLYQDKHDHKKKVLEKLDYQRPRFPKGEPQVGEAATLELMQHGRDFHNHIPKPLMDDPQFLANPLKVKGKPGRLFRAFPRLTFPTPLWFAARGRIGNHSRQMSGLLHSVSGPGQVGCSVRRSAPNNNRRRPSSTVPDPVF